MQNFQTRNDPEWQPINRGMNLFKFKLEGTHTLYFNTCSTLLFSIKLKVFTIDKSVNFVAFHVVQWKLIRCAISFISINNFNFESFVFFDMLNTCLCRTVFLLLIVPLPSTTLPEKILYRAGLSEILLFQVETLPQDQI